jgi:CheY-like chemotaxis protein
MIQEAKEAATAREVVLVVDDEILLRSLISDYLRDEGFQVVEAGSSDEAIEYLQSDNWVGLVFSDVTMPGSLNGVALAHKLRRDYPELPVLLTSANFVAQPGDLEITIVPKPYRFAEVTMMICDMLDDAGAQKKTFDGVAREAR